MSDEDTIGGDDRHDFTAAEYVLGVLERRGSARRGVPHGERAQIRGGGRVLGDASWRIGGIGSRGRAASQSLGRHRGSLVGLARASARARRLLEQPRLLADLRHCLGRACCCEHGRARLSRANSLAWAAAPRNARRAIGSAGISRRRQSSRRHRHRGAGGASHRRATAILRALGHSARRQAAFAWPCRSQASGEGGGAAGASAACQRQFDARDFASSPSAARQPASRPAR